MERVAYVVGTANSPQYADDDIGETLPIHYRIVKLEIKAQQGTQEVVHPSTDAFLDQHGLPIGVDSPNFDRLVIKYAPINTKKYTKKSDIQGTLFQNNVITPTLVGNAGTANAYTDTVTRIRIPSYDRDIHHGFSTQKETRFTDINHTQNYIEIPNISFK